jgi:methylmalonyl-CoA mutase N-terminal domain/subunit
VEREQNRVLARRRADRDGAQVAAALAALVEVARTDANMVPAMLDAARAEATLGEICDALRGEWGDYREPPRF